MSEASSMASSSKNSGSHSSKFSSRSQHGPLANRIGLFPLLSHHELVADWKLTLTGFLIQLFQLLGLVVNPTFPAGASWRGSVAQILYFFDAPFFDSGWVASDVSTIVAHVCFWLAVLIAGVLIAAGVVNATSTHQSLPLGLQRASQLAVHGLSSPLLIPATSSIMAFMVCDTDRESLFWLGKGRDSSVNPANQYACTGALAITYFAVGSVTLCVLSVVSFFSAATLFDDIPESSIRGVSARATSFTAQCGVLVRITLAITFHVLVSAGYPQVFAGLMTAVCWLHATQYAFHLPFYTTGANRWFCAVYSCSGFVALIAAVQPSAGSNFDGSSNAVLSQAIGGVGALLVGALLPDLRVSGRCAEQLNRLRRGEVLQEMEPVFPVGLPVNDLAHSKFTSLESEINPKLAQGAATYGAQTDDDDDEDDADLPGLLRPYIERVWVPSDIELASRFLHHYRDATDTVPTDSMCGMAARLFTKGLARFRRDPLVVYHFCGFLFNFAMRYRIALSEAESIAKLDAPMVLQYRAHRMQVHLKSSLNMTDTTHLKLFNSTLRLHKEILGHMAFFWAKLLSNNVDIVQLAAIANFITAKRETCEAQYDRVLEHANANIMSRYARFLEQVMIDGQGAKLIRDQLAEDAEQRKSRMLRRHGGGGGAGGGDKRGGGGSQSMMRSMSSSVRNRISQRQRTNKAEGSTTISRMSASVNTMFIGLIALSILVFVYEAVRASETHKIIDRLNAAGRMRALASLGTFYMTEVNQVAFANDSNHNHENTTAAARAALLTVGSEIFSIHSQLTHGRFKSTFPPHVKFYNTPTIEILEPDTTGTSLSGDYRRVLTDFFTLGNRIAAVFTGVALANVTTPQVAALLRFGELNANDALIKALNTMLHLHEEEAAAVSDVAFWAAIGIFGVGVIVLFVVYCIMVLNFNKIGVAKLSTLNLFTLIPRGHLEGLKKSSQELLDHFDEEEQDDNVEPSLWGRDDGRKPPDPVAASTAAMGGPRRITSAATVAAPATELPGAVAEERDVNLGREGVPRLGEGVKNGNGQKRRQSVNAFFDRNGSPSSGGGAMDEAADTFAEDIDGSGLMGDSFAGDSDGDAIEKEENKRQDRGSRSSLTLQDIVSGAGLVAALVVVLGITITTFALGLELHSSIKSTESALHDLEKRGSAENELYRQVRLLSKHAQIFTITGDPVALQLYHDTLQSGKLEMAYDFLTGLDNSPDALRLLIDFHTIFDGLLMRHSAAIHLAASAFNTSERHQRLLPQPRPYNFTRLAPVVAETFFTFTVSPSPFPATDHLRDAALPKPQKLNVARSLLFDDLYAAHLSAIDRLRHLYTQETDGAGNRIYEESRRRHDLFSSTVALYALCMVFVATIALRVLASASHALRLVSIAALTLLVACVVVMVVIFIHAPSFERSFERLRSIRELSNSTFSIVALSDDYARAFAQWGERDRFRSFAALRAADEWESSLGALTEVLLSGEVRNDESMQFRVAEQVLQLRRFGEEQFALGDVSILQAAWARSLASDEEFSSASSVVYNRVREPRAEADLLLFGIADPTIYTNISGDSARPPAELLGMAVATVANERHRHTLQRVLDALSGVVDEGRLAVEAEIADVSSHANILLDILVGLSAGTLVIVVLIGMYVAFASIYNMATAAASSVQSSSGTAASAQKKSRSILFDSLTIRTRITLSIVTLCLISVFIFDVHVLSGFEGRMGSLNLASARAAVQLRSANIIQQILHQDRIHGNSSSIPRRAITGLAQELEDLRMRLFLGSVSSGRYPIINRYPEHNREQFVFDSFKDVTLQSRCPDAENEDETAGFFPDGPDAAFVEWAQWLQQLALMPNAAAAKPLLLAFQSRAVPLAESLFRSAAFLHSAAHDDVRERTAIHYALAATLTCAFLLTFAAVFRPMIRHLLEEEEGTKMLLRMIPQAVRQDVPAIAEYLETGTIAQNERMQRINQAVSDLSTVSLIVIDDFGTVLRMSRASQDIFGYEVEEVIGRNVKILMPENTASEHDTYLANYRKTGIKHIVDAVRRVTARGKDGNHFPIELVVREFRVSATQSNFLAFVRNIATEVQFEHATHVNEAVSDMSHIPVLVINSAGSIFRVNRAACDAFGYSAAELMNKNVKMLMPMRIAKKHDGYLANYQRTRVKSIIDSRRVLSALRRSGEEFPAELMIREMLSDKGVTQYFVGYVRDITSDLLFQQNIMANEAVIEISPTPVISITPQGQITQFSPAAEKVWGWHASEVVGRNVRVLMNDEDAKAHDGYLARYMKTGVKSIIDSTRIVKAKRADGTLFSIETNIKEIRRDDHVSFIAYLRDLSVQMKQDHANQTAEVAFAACPLPVVCIDDHGYVRRFNSAAERMLGYRSEQVLGHNVKMLMPQEIASQHDEYLSRYRETGVKNIIDSKRRTYAQARSGKNIAIEIQVREVITKHIMSASGTKRLFIGYLRDVSEEMQMLKANELNDAITDLSTVPMISIDISGTILTFSLAAVQAWGITAKDAIGKNVKILMPDEVAVHHDGYLAKYRETGEKHIIDAEREVHAKRGDGTTFPIAIKVREVHKAGMEPVYVGYCRETSHEILVEDSQRLVRTIISTSPVPIVVINIKGIIQVFSAEAERVFGWSSADVVGKNVKLLMPPDIARRHDGFLKQYRKTGVKNIIDATRNVQALKRDGLAISCEIVVKEVRSDAVKESLSVPDDAMFVGYLRDKSQEYILRQSNELKDVILKESSVPMVHITTAGIIIFANPACCAEFQYTQEELIGQNVKILTPRAVAEKHDEYLRRYLETGEKHIIDNLRTAKAVRKDGTEFSIEISVRELVIDGQRSFFGYIRNNAQQLRIQDEKHAGETIVEVSSTPLIIIDEVGTITTFNAAAAQCFDYQQHEVLGKNVKMLQPADVASVHDEYLANYKKYRQKSIIDTTRRIMARRKSGRLFPAEIMVRELEVSSSRGLTYAGYIRDVTDEYRLRVANELADTVSSLSPIPLIAMTCKGIIVKFSQAAEEQFGFNASDVVGQNITIIQPPDIAVHHDEYLQRYMRTGVKTVVDSTRVVTAKHRDGTLFPAEITVREIRKEGTDHTFIGFVRDLRRQRAELASARLLATTLDMMPTPLIVIDPAGVISMVNRATLSSFGYEQEELMSRNVKLLMPEDVAANHDFHLEAYRRTHIKHVVDSRREVMAKQKDGHLIPVEICVKEMKSDDLARTFFFGFMRMLSEEKSLQRAFHLNETVSHMIGFPIVVINIKGSIIKFSHNACTAFGYNLPEVLNKNVNMLMPKRYADKHDGYLAAYAETHVRHVIGSTREVECRRKDGTEFSAELQVSEVVVKGGGSMYVGFLRDVTKERQQLEEAHLIDTINTLSGLAVVMIDPTGIICEVSEAVSRIVGYAPIELIGKNVKVLMPSHIADRHDDYLDAYARTGKKHIIGTLMQTSARHKSGHLVTIELGVREIAIESIGRRFIGSLRDISREAQSETFDKYSEAIISLSSVPIITIDSDGVITAFSPLACRMFECSEKDVIGQNVKLLMPDEVALHHDSYLKCYLETGVKNIIDAERQVVAKRPLSGKAFSVHISVREIAGASGSKYFVGYLKPV